MTEKTLINNVFGKEWDSLNVETKKAVEKMLSWMHLNLGITKDPPTNDDYIIAAVQLAVIEVFGETYESIMTKGRKRDKVDKKHMIYKIVRDMSKSIPSKIARLFPNANRATAMYFAQRKTQDLIESDAGFRYNYTKLKDSVERHYTDILNEKEKEDVSGN